MDQNKEVPNNASALNTQNVKPLITDVSKYINQKYLKFLILAVSITVVLIIILFIYSKTWLLSLYPIFAFIIFYSILRQRAEDAFFQQFSSINGFSFRKDGLPSKLEGSLFFVGHSPTGRDLISGTFKNTPFVLFNYQYTIGSGKNSHTYTYTTFRMDYPSSLPPIFMKSKYCIFGGFLFGDISKNAKERLTLEGDFDKHYDLWTEKGFEIEALQVFSPDFMSKIESNWKKFGLEFINNQIYIYSHHMITKDEELENMYELLQYLISKISPLAKEIKGDINSLNEYYK